jgi:membrane protein YdbS with pleckstrin-like domain
MRSVWVPRRAMHLALIESLCGTLVTALITTAALLVIGEPWVRYVVAAIGVVIVAAGTIEGLVFVPIAVRHFRLAISRSELRISRGAFFRTLERVPREKVTSVRVRSTPLLRRFGLVRCVLITPAFELALPPLDAESAQAVASICADG